MPTLKEIAREAGVSGALVSYYLNGGGKGRMREETRRRIDEAIRKLKEQQSKVQERSPQWMVAEQVFD